MGVMESWYFLMYSLCWHSQKLGCTYFESEVGEFGYLDI